MLISVMRKKKSRKGKKRNISKAQLRAEQLQALYKKWRYLAPQTSSVDVRPVTRDGSSYADTKTHSFQKFYSSSCEAARKELNREAKATLL